MDLSRREMLKTIGLTGLAAAGTGAIFGPRAMGQSAELALAAAPKNYVLFADGQYQLPPLPYGYDALEPVIDQQTLTLHHDKHHAGYVNGLNKTLSALAEARKAGSFDHVQALSRDLAFHGSGHVLHSIYWLSMKPKGGGEPGGALAEQIKADFGSVKAFQDQMTAATTKVEASGWGVLAWEPIARALRVFQAERHQDLTQWGVVPLMVIDVWEHAYYLKYQNRRADYVKAFWNVADWDGLAARWTQVKSLTLV